MDRVEERARRAQALLVVAALGLIVAGVVYLRPSMAAPESAATPANRPPPAANVWLLAWASFLDSNHGAVELYHSGVAPTMSFLTFDGGRTWHKVAHARVNGLAQASFIDPNAAVAQTTNNVIPSKNDPNAAHTVTVVSVDGGRTWRNLTDPRSNNWPGLPIFLDQHRAWWVEQQQSPYATAPAVIWRTTDGGGTWQRLVGSGLPGSGFPGQILFTDPLHGALVFVSVDRSTSLLTTDDGGDSWHAAEAPTVPLPDSRVLSWSLVKHGQRLLAWLMAVPASTLTAAGTVISSNGSSLVAYTVFVSMSDDAGQTWSQPRAGPNVVQPGYFAAVHREDGRGRLFMVDEHRLWVSQDDGASWSARVLQAPAGLKPATLVSADHGAFLALAVQAGPADMVTPSSALTLIRSSDGGAHWSQVALPRP